MNALVLARFIEKSKILYFGRERNYYTFACLFVVFLPQREVFCGQDYPGIVLPNTYLIYHTASYSYLEMWWNKRKIWQKKTWELYKGKEIIPQLSSQAKQTTTIKILEKRDCNESQSSRNTLDLYFDISQS